MNLSVRILAGLQSSGFLRLRSPSATDDRLDWAKLVAVVLMVADHVLIALPSPWARWGYLLGRPCVPIFAYVMTSRLADGPIERSARMLARVLVFGMIAQPVYGALLGGFLARLNILFPLAAGVGLIHLLARRQLIGSGLGAILLAYLDRWLDSGAVTALGQAAAFLAWRGERRGLALWIITGAAMLQNLAAIPLDWGAALCCVAAPAIIAASGAMAPPRWRLPGLAFYAFYPLHLFAIWLVFGPYR
jgi:hypothetical protein